MPTLTDLILRYDMLLVSNYQKKITLNYVLVIRYMDQTMVIIGYLS